MLDTAQSGDGRTSDDLPLVTDESGAARIDVQVTIDESF